MDPSSDSEFRTPLEFRGEPRSVPFSITRSCDRIGVPGWAPILEGLPVGARSRSSENLHFLP